MPIIVYAAGPGRYRHGYVLDGGYRRRLCDPGLLLYARTSADGIGVVWSYHREDSPFINVPDGLDYHRRPPPSMSGEERVGCVRCLAELFLLREAMK